MTDTIMTLYKSPRNNAVITQLSPSNHPLSERADTVRTSFRAGLFRYVAVAVLLLCLSIGNVWGETAVATTAGTYSAPSSSPCGAAYKFGELSTNSVFLYRNSTWAYGQNGVTASSSNNSGFVFYINSPMTLSATIYQNSTTAETVTIDRKSVV